MSIPLFIRLPGELRNQIYDYLVVLPTMVERATDDQRADKSAFDSRSASDFSNMSETSSTSDSIEESLRLRRRPLCPPTVTHVCRRMREEALSMYYADNIFVPPSAIFSSEPCKNAALRASELETPNDLNSPIGMLTAWLHDIGLSQVKYLNRIVLPIAHEYPRLDPSDRMESSHQMWLVIDFGSQGKTFSRSSVGIYTQPGVKRFCKPTATTTRELEPGHLGHEWDHSPDSEGCGPLNLFLFEFLSAQEPDANGVRRVQTDEDDEDTSDSDESQDNERDEWAEECGVDLQKEVVPATYLYPTTDIFTGLSIVEGAFMTHCRCCMKSPATTVPIRRSRRGSYLRPYHDIEKDFCASDYDSFNEYNDGNLPVSPGHGIWRRGEIKALRKQLRIRAQRRARWRAMEAIVALDIEYEADASRAHRRFEKRWKEARSKAGRPVVEKDKEEGEVSD